MRSLLCICLIALLLPFAAATTPPIENTTRVRYIVTLDNLFTQEQAAAHLAQYGKVLGRNGSEFVVAAHSNEEAKSTYERLNQDRRILSAEAIAPELPYNMRMIPKVSELKMVLSEYQEAFHAFRSVVAPSGEGSERENRPPGLSFISAYLEHIEIRAFPYDEIDWNAYGEAVYHRMLKFQPQGLDLGRGSMETMPASASSPNTADWVYLGPTNLDKPYTIYYGERPMNGRVNALAIHPTNTNIVYMGGAQGGVWRSTDRGQTWTPLTDDWPFLHISAIAIDPTNPDRIYVGTGDYNGFNSYTYGIMRSVDGGNSWIHVPNPFSNRAISAIIIHPDQPNIVLASTGRGSNGTRGIFRSTNFGQSFSSVLTGGVDFSSMDISVPDAQGNRIIYATASGSGNYFRSTNNGASFQSMGNPTGSQSQNITRIAASKLYPNVAYVVAGTARSVYKTTNGGTNWSNVTNNFPNGNNNYNWSQSWYDIHIGTTYQTVPTEQDVVYVGLIDIVISRNGGSSWRSMGGANFTATYTNNAITHNDQHCMAIDPLDNSKVIIGNDGGAYEITFNYNNDTYQYTHLSEFMGISQFYSTAVHPTDPLHVMGGTQDNATPHSLTDLQNWRNFGGGDGAGCAINTNNPANQYASAQRQIIYRTANTWASSSQITPNYGDDRRPFIGTMALSWTNPNLLYVGTNFLWRYNNSNNTWLARLGGYDHTNGTGTIRTIMVTPGNGARIYTGSTDGAVNMTTDVGSNWVRLDNAGFPNRAVTCVNVHPTNQVDLLVTVSGTGTGHLWRCLNTDAQNPVWIDVSGSGSTGLPNVPANTVARDIYDPDRIWYVGTDIGVYVTYDAGGTWHEITNQNGLPNVQVNALVSNANTGFLTAGTFGRGMWHMDIRPKPSSLSFDPPAVLGGQSSTGTVVLNRPAPVGGFTVNLQSNDASVTVPASVVVQENSTSATFTATSTSVAEVKNVTVTATIGPHSEQAELIVHPNVSFVTEFDIIEGQIAAGTVANLQEKNGQFLELNRIVISSGTPIKTVFEARTTAPPIGSQMTVRLSRLTQGGPGSELIQLYNYSTGQFDTIIEKTINTTNIDDEVTVDMADYRHPSTGVVRLRGTHQGIVLGSGAAWRLLLDRLNFLYAP